MISKESFDCFWQEYYTDIVPLGYVLREHFHSDRWFRIHTLPNSKRYAENEDEKQIILNRQNTLITDLIGEQCNYLLILSAWSETLTIEPFSEINQAIALDDVRLNGDSYKLNEGYLNFAIVNKHWEVGSIDDYLIAVANEEPLINSETCEAYCFMIIDIEKNRIIAPYDGGVDVFLSTTQERDYFKLKYKDWLSSHEHGL